MQQADISLADAQGSPVTHVFASNGVETRPDGTDSVSRAEWVDRSAAAAIGNWRIWYDYKQRKSDGTYKLKLFLALPTLENVSNSTISGIAPAPTLAYTVQATVDFAMPQRCSLQNRKDLRKMIANLLANAQVIQLIESPERVN